MLLPQIMLSLGCVAVIYGSFRAWQQVEMKRLLAFSSVAQIGYMVIGLALINQLGLTASILHLFNHAIIKSTLFIGAGILLYRANTTELRSLRGLGKDMPWTFAAITLAGLSLIGVPGTVGFVTKWYLLEAAVEKGMWIVVGTIVIGSVLAIAYVWKIIENLYFRSKRKLHIQDVTSGDTGVARAPRTMTVALWIGAIMCIVFGLNTELSFEAASSAAKALLER
jgi:multicomponent Na+:H+ antiporter subunit D